MAETVMTYSDVLSRNLRAQLGAAGINQGLLADRMKALGYTAWLRQTVANVAKGRRGLRAEEIVGLAAALGTSIATLMAVPLDVQFIALPSGDVVPAKEFTASLLLHRPLRALAWDGSTPRWFTDKPELARDDDVAYGAQVLRAEGGNWEATAARMQTLVEQLRDRDNQIAELRRKLGEGPQS